MLSLCDSITNRPHPASHPRQEVPKISLLSPLNIEGETLLPLLGQGMSLILSYMHGFQAPLAGCGRGAEFDGVTINGIQEY